MITHTQFVVLLSVNTGLVILWSVALIWMGRRFQRKVNEMFDRFERNTGLTEIETKS